MHMKEKNARFKKNHQRTILKISKYNEKKKLPQKEQLEKRGKN